MIGIIGALNDEMAAVISHMDNHAFERISSIDFHTGTLSGKEVCAAVCGMGKVNAAVCAQIMITRFGIDCLINTGIGGALDTSLRQLDMVVASDFVQHDIDVSAIDDVPPGYITELKTVRMPADGRLHDILLKACRIVCHDRTRSGVFATGDQFIAGRDIAAGLRKRFGADVCDMESGSMAQVCALAGIPFAAVRCISDSADEPGENTYFEFKEICCKRGTSIILEAVREI